MKTRLPGQNLIHDVTCVHVFSVQFPEITAFIMRRFKGENDVEETYDLVRKVRYARVVFLCIHLMYTVDHPLHDLDHAAGNARGKAHTSVQLRT